MNFRKDVQNLTEAYKQINESGVLGHGTKMKTEDNDKGRTGLTHAELMAQAKARGDAEAAKAREMYDRKITGLVNVHKNNPAMKGLDRAQVEADLRKTYPNLSTLNKFEDTILNTNQLAQMQDKGDELFKQDVIAKNQATTDAARQQMKQLGYNVPDPIKTPTTPTTPTTPVKTPSISTTGPTDNLPIDPLAAAKPGLKAGAQAGSAFSKAAPYLAGAGAGLVAAKLLSKKKKDDDDE